MEIYNNEKYGHKFQVGEGLDEKVRSSLLREKIRPVDFAQIHTISDLVDAWGRCGIQSRRLSECAKVYESMLTDKSRPTIMLGLSGPLIAGGMRKIIRDMIAAAMVDVIVSTGAILYQDYYAAKGYSHYQGDSESDDSRLHDLYINRIYDTYVDEIGFIECDNSIAAFCDSLEVRRYSTREFLHLLGGTLSDSDSILHTAFCHNVPIFCPAIADSSIGIGITQHYRNARARGVQPIIVDTVRDNFEIGQIVLKSRKTGAIYVGGGVPKNYINDATVMFDGAKGHSYAFQITADSPHWGGLSGSTLDEAKSWGKVSTAAVRATVYGEATVILPIIFGAMLQKDLHRCRHRLEFLWEGDLLTAIQIASNPVEFSPGPGQGAI
ncbi:MAG: deoxyhypusine synthase family protein [Candidatus Methanosuratus sp.]|nr:deoxyhypusine synthase family protein [Candidatus Methanosuratincola sp.]